MDSADAQWDIFQKGFEAGQLHKTSSPETKERISKLEQDIHKELDGKISNKIFGIVVSFFIGLVGAMFYLVYNQGQSTQETIIRVSSELETKSILTNNSIINLESQLRAKDVIK